MSEINLKLKTYDELTFEITRLNTCKYLLEQKLQQKENKEKEIRKYMKKISEEYMRNENESIIARKVLEILDKENK